MASVPANAGNQRATANLLLGGVVVLIVFMLASIFVVFLAFAD